MKRLVKHVTPKVSWQDTTPEPTSDTSATDTDPIETLKKNPQSSTPASITSLSSIENTVWTSPPIGFAASDRVITPAEVNLLPEPLRQKFINIAFGRNREPGDFVRDIVSEMTEDFMYEIRDETLLQLVQQYFRMRII
jgi:hypothetical protein